MTVLVRNYDEALSWYTNVLGLKKIEDRSFGPGRRWIVVAPEGQPNPGIVLDLPPSTGMDIQTPSGADRIGKETDWVFQVKNCRAFYDIVSRRGGHFIKAPTDQPWGTTQAILQDLYGNIIVVESGPSGDVAGQHGGQ